MLKNRFEKIMLYATAFTVGAVILAVEILGTRIVAPFYGTTIYVWSSLIGVTMLALAGGYFLGGMLADKKPSFVPLALIIAGAAFATGLLPSIDKAVLSATNSLGSRLGALTSCFALFTLPLLLLGMVSPYLVKIGGEKSEKLGNIAGSLYGVSTIGSFAGAVGTGFFLIPAIGISNIIYLCSGILALTALAWFIYSRSKAGIAAALVAFIPALFTMMYGQYGGYGVKIIYEKESPYASIKVFDSGDSFRLVTMDGGIQSGIDLRTGRSDWPYMKLMRESLDYAKGAKNALVVGLGAGEISQFLLDAGLEVDSLEFDPVMANVAKEFFGFKGSAIINDGRNYIRNTKKKYDMVVLDVYRGYSIYPYLFSKEAFEEIKSIMTPGGLLVVNGSGIIESKDKTSDPFVASVEKTLKSVFHGVYTRATNLQLSNVVYLASEKAVPAKAGWLTPALTGKAVIFTDDHNPSDYFATAAMELDRKATVEMFGGKPVM